MESHLKWHDNKPEYPPAIGQKTAQGFMGLGFFWKRLPYIAKGEGQGGKAPQDSKIGPPPPKNPEKLNRSENGLHTR